jgi:hypothetical protein
MAGTAANWRIASMSAYPGQMWVNLAIPAAGAFLTLATDGTPDATANPNAQHIGGTKAGTKLMLKPKFNNFSIDEKTAPVITAVGGNEMGISAELAAVNDTNVLSWMLPGIGTRSVTASTSEQITIGIRSIIYSSIAVIFPLQADPTKFGFFHIYKGLNDSGVEWSVTRTEAGYTPVSIVGYEITTRAAADSTGAFQIQSGTPATAWT